MNFVEYNFKQFMAVVEMLSKIYPDSVLEKIDFNKIKIRMYHPRIDGGIPVSIINIDDEINNLN